MRLSDLAKVADTAPHLVMVRHANGEIEPQTVSRASHKSGAWRKAGFAATAGVLFGIVAAACFRPGNLPVGSTERTFVENSDVQQTSLPPAAEPVSATALTHGPAVDSVEMERLKTRNRRLEVLVRVLKERTQTKQNSAPANN